MNSLSLFLSFTLEREFITKTQNLYKLILIFNNIKQMSHKLLMCN